MDEVLALMPVADRVPGGNTAFTCSARSLLFAVGRPQWPSCTRNSQAPAPISSSSTPARASGSRRNAPRTEPSDIAIVGMAAVMPGAGPFPVLVEYPARR